MAVAESEKISLALADPNPLMLGALSEVIDQDERFALLFTAKSVEHFRNGIARIPVQVALVDWYLPKPGTEALLEELRGMPQAPRPVVYGVNPESDIIRKAMAAGASGLSTRNDPSERLLDIVATVAAGQMVFPQFDLRQLNKDAMGSLTVSERELLAALAKGHSNKELAREFEISINTVKFHLKNVFDKLAVKTRGQAIAAYYEAQSQQARG